MLLEKYSRFFRKFEIGFNPRHKDAPRLPMWDDPKNKPSVYRTIKKYIDADKAQEAQPNGDIVELMDVDYRAKEKVLVVLVHRASPNATDPSYRRKARKSSGKKVVLRHTEKAEEEDQSVSAHLVIADLTLKNGARPAALEEVPGIGMGIIKRIIASAMNEYPYSYKRGQREIETSSRFTPQGVKSETLTNALKNGSIGFITLSRVAKSTLTDDDNTFKAEREVLRLRVSGKIDKKNWKGVFASLVSRAKADGWEDFKVDVNLDDKRTRTVKIDREDEASEILFVRSEQADFDKPLRSCSETFVEEVIDRALKIAKAK